MTLLRRRAALDAWLERAEALLHERPDAGNSEPEEARRLDHHDAA